MFTLYRIALCTYKNGDFGAISVAGSKLHCADLLSGDG